MKTQCSDDSKKIITDSLAFNIFHNKDAFREKTDGKHISITLFDDPKHLKEITLKLLQTYIKQSNTKSVIGLTETDPSLTIFATQASFIKEIPYYNYDLENDAGAFSQFIRPEIVPCTLIIPYSINEIHILEIVDRFSQQKVPISQVISMVDENPSKTTFSDKDFDFVSVCDWISLKNRITKFNNITSEKMNEILSNFG
ncbi:MAG: hypothetical protein CO032_08280 [Nitrosopumilales archaeon CG_4_9_14_0_2_um_filter_34_16]|nr:MAG: hypothetical protein CO032_08280 [Nitrosopumilales archaeon CG_4_9_14_0_2_um_filter_34_16]